MPQFDAANGLDEFHFHEVLDRTHIIAMLLSDHLMEHPVIRQNPEWLDLVSNALDSLNELYQAVGEVHIEPRGCGIHDRDNIAEAEENPER